MIPVSKFRGTWLYQQLQVQFKTTRPSNWKHPLRSLVWMVKRDFEQLRRLIQAIDARVDQFENSLSRAWSTARIAVTQWDRAMEEAAERRKEVAEVKQELDAVKQELHAVKQELAALKLHFAKIATEAKDASDS